MHVLSGLVFLNILSSHHDLNMDLIYCGVSQYIWGLQVFISNGCLSDIVIVVAITNREAHSPAHGISLFLVETGMKGFIKGRKLHKMGLKAQVSYNMNY